MDRIVTAIKAAEGLEKRALYELLYMKNLPLLRKIAARYRGVCKSVRSVDEDDLLQAGYFALVAAAEAYDPERGKWTQIASYYIRRAIRSTIGIYGDTPHAALNALSLNAPASEDSGAAFIDLLEDEAQMEIDDMLLRSEISAVVRQALSSMKDRSASAMIQRIDIDGLSFKEVAREYGVSPQRARSMRRAGYHELRRNPAMKKLADSYALDEQTRFYKHKGVKRFRADWSSTTEDAVLWRLKMTNEV